MSEVTKIVELATAVLQLATVIILLKDSTKKK